MNRKILAQFGMPAPEEPAEWLDALVGLLTSSSDRRAELGALARSVVSSEYSYDAWLERWREATGFAVGRRAT